MRLAFRALGFEQHHVFREPALFVAVVARDAQREALLPEQRVPAVAGADGPDGVVLREVADVAALRIEIGDGVDAAIEARRISEAVERDLPDAGHDPHVEHDVDRVGDLDADHGEGRVGLAHEVGDHVHGAALHRTIGDLAELSVRLFGRHPVVRVARTLFGGRADERQLLGARDIVGVASAVERVRLLLLVQRREHAHRDGLFGEPLGLLVAAVDPIDLVGLAELRDLIDPRRQMRVRGGPVLRDDHSRPP